MKLKPPPDPRHRYWMPEDWKRGRSLLLILAASRFLLTRPGFCSQGTTVWPNRWCLA